MTFNLEKIKLEIANAKIINKPVEPKHNHIIEESTGYYTLPCSREPFEGEVIKLSGDEMFVLFQRYSNGDEHRFREKLTKYDDWFFDKAHRVQQNWMNYITKWLMEG